MLAVCFVCFFWGGGGCRWSRAAVTSALAYLAKEDPLGYFANPVDVSLVPGYKDVVSVGKNKYCRVVPSICIHIYIVEPVGVVLSQQ